MKNLLLLLISNVLCLFDSLQLQTSTNTIGISFSPAGLLTPFHIGASYELKRRNVLTSNSIVAGASGGALAAATSALNIDSAAALDACCYIARRCRDEGTPRTLRDSLDEVLISLLPHDSHLILRERQAECIVAYTEVSPKFQPHFVKDFNDKDDLIDCLRSSCNIPFYFNGINPVVDVRNAKGIDGKCRNDLRLFTA